MGVDNKNSIGSEGSQLSNQEVVRGFQGGEISGRIVMERLLAKVDRSDFAEEPLIKRDGSPLVDEHGKQAKAVDYLKVAGKHGSAVDTILKFVYMSESHEQYGLVKGGVTKMIDGYLGI
jgi:hypothetical protein